MKTVTLRWLLPCSALFLFGPAASKLVGWLRATDGSSDVTFLANDVPVLGLLSGIGVIALAMVPALIAARTIGAKAALAPFTLTLAWAAFFTSPIDRLARWQDPGSLFAAVAIENAVLGLVGLGAIWMLVRLGTPETGTHATIRSEEASKKSLLSPASGAGLVAGAIAAWVVCWLVAREEARGQAILAAFLAGIGAGAAGAWVGPLLAKDDARVSSLAPMASMVLVAALGPIVALVTIGAGELAEAAARGGLFGAVRLQAFDALVGAGLGVPIGTAWVGSVAHEHAPASA